MFGTCQVTQAEACANSTKSGRRRSLSRLFTLAALSGLSLALSACGGDDDDAPPLFPDQPDTAQLRAKELVKAMTLDEKAKQMQGFAPAIPRLAIPRYGWINEALHGVAWAGYSTVYPQSIGLAATWDTALVQQVADTIATEGRAIHNRTFKRDGATDIFYGVNYWSPNINIFRDPRWGRGQETYGEDPTLSGKMVTAFVRGLQGDDPVYYKAIATPKHFAVHSGPEYNRHGFAAKVSAFDLADTYTPAFRAGLVDGKAASLMCSFNSVGNMPMCANELLNKLVRKEWGFRGFIVSDCDAVTDIARFGYAPDNAHGAALAVKAGLDLECSWGNAAYNSIPQAVRDRLLTEAEVDTSVIRLMTYRIKMGLLGGSKFDTIGPEMIDAPEHRLLALKAAREAMTLLKNTNDLLPLSRPKKVAVIGPNARLLQSVEANYPGTAVDPVFPVDGMRAEFGADNIAYAAGATLKSGLRLPVPSNALRPAADSTEAGLKGEYYSNRKFEGVPKLTRIDPAIDFNWRDVGPVKDFGTAKFSVRWTGLFTPPAPGNYTLGFNASGSVKLRLDDKEFSNGQQFVFTDTKPHKILIEYARDGGDYHGFIWQAPVSALIDEAVAAVNKSDVAVAFVGLSHYLEGEERSGDDRSEITLPASQLELLKQVKATGKPLVVVYITGGAISDPWVEENADALVQAWYPGVMGGTAIAETLTGKNNPAGRLPYTIYRDIKDLPNFEDYDMRSGKGRTYRYFTGDVLHPFGAGLSYTKFAYADPKLSTKTLTAGNALSVTTTVKNTGSRDGDEVVQVYVKQPGAAAKHVLAGFMRTFLKAGETRSITVPIDARALSQVDVNGNRAVQPGDYTVYMGGGQPGFPASNVTSAKFVVSGSFALPN